MNSKNEALVVEANTGTQFTYRTAKPGDDLRRCLCGCELQVVGKAIYRPGHDARHVSQLATEIVQMVELGQHHAKITKATKAAFQELQGVKLVGKLAARLAKSIPARAESIENAAEARIEELTEDEED